MMTTEQTSNEDILEFIKKLKEDQDTILEISKQLSPEEIKALKQLVKERQAYALVFSKLNVIGGMVSAVILTIFSFLIDWHKVVGMFKGGT